MVDTNLTSTFLCSRAAYPHLKRAGGGKIVNVGSMMSVFGAPYAPAYAASKGGVVQLTKSMATAWAADPYARGAISYCVPGRSGARALLAQPVGGRLVFAGEHTEPTAYGTLHGAHRSGIRAAAEAHRLLAQA